MLVPWKKNNKPRQHIKKQGHDFADKILYGQCWHMQMWEVGNKKGWALMIGCLWTVCWRRLLRVPWPIRRSNQSILKEINPEYSLEVLMLKLKFQCFGHLMQRTDSLEKTLMLGKIEGRRRSGWQRTWWLDGISDSVGMSLSKLWKIVKDREAWHATVHGVTKSLTWLSNWTTTSHMPKLLSKGWFLLTTDLISEYTPGVGWEISNYPLLIP